MLFNNSKFREAFRPLATFVDNTGERLAIRCENTKATHKKLRGRTFGFTSGDAKANGSNAPVDVIQVYLLTGNKVASELFILYAVMGSDDHAYAAQFQNNYITQPNVIEELLTIAIGVMNSKEIKAINPTRH